MTSASSQIADELAGLRIIPQLRHPVGPDAAGFLGWRASMTDEQWVEWGAMSDEQWVAYVRQNFGLSVSL